MASIIDTTRIVDLPTKASLSEGDVFVVDNENGATSKIPATAVSGSSTAGLVAEEYRDSKTYKVGEYCIHVEAGIPKFYKCTTAIDTAEAWTPAHWEGTDAGTEITDLNQNLGELQTVHTTELTSTYVSQGIKFWRCGKMARMTILGIKSLPTGQTNIATIPEGYRPYEIDAFTKDLLDSNLSPKLRIFCDATGKYLRIYNYTGAAMTLTNLQIETEYFTQ